MKELNTQTYWSFVLGTQEGNNVPIWIIVGFHQQDRQTSQNLNNDTFYRPPVTSTQVLIGSKKYPDNSILINPNDDDYSQGYGRIEEAFKALTKDDILQPYISNIGYRASNDGNTNGYNQYVFDITYQKRFESAQPQHVENKH